MFQPLFLLVFLEVVLILTLLFRTPLRRPLISGLDRLKQGRGPVVSKTIGATLFAILISLLSNITKFQKRAKDSGTVSPTDQVLLANHLLHASLLGFALVLALMIDRLHYYIKELRLLRKHLESAKRSKQ